MGLDGREKLGEKLGEKFGGVPSLGESLGEPRWDMGENEEPLVETISLSSSSSLGRGGVTRSISSARLLLSGVEGGRGVVVARAGYGRGVVVVAAMDGRGVVVVGGGGGLSPDVAVWGMSAGMLGM